MDLSAPSAGPTYIVEFGVPIGSSNATATTENISEALSSQIFTNSLASELQLKLNSDGAAVAPAPSAPTTRPNTANSEKKSNNSNVILGASIGVGLFVVLATTAAFMLGGCCKKKEKENSAKVIEKDWPQTGPPSEIELSHNEDQGPCFRPADAPDGGAV